MDKSTLRPRPVQTRPFEGRVTEHGTRPGSFRLDDGDQWFRMPAQWLSILPGIGLYVNITVISGEVISLKVRSAFRDRVIGANKELEQV